MARRLKPPKAAHHHSAVRGDAHMPTKEAIAAFIAESPGKVGKREIARAFGIGGGERIWLKRMLRELEDEGVIDRRRKVLHKAGRLPPVVLADITGRDADGELVAEPAEWSTEEDGKAPRIIIAPSRRQRAGEPAPGVGDRALIRVEPAGEEGPQVYTGRIIKLIAKMKAQVLGVYRTNRERGGGYLVSVDKKSLGREIIIPAGAEGEAEDGDLVSVSVARGTRLGPPQAKVRERLGSLKSERAISLVAIHAHGIPHVFPPAVLREAEAAKPATLAGREDWRALPLVTIDPADAKDHDDAVHAEPDEDPDNPGGHVLHVAIADVAAYVTPGSALDREALERGNSVYFPDRVVPMLPERISNDLCSLRPGEERPALAVRIVIDANGRKKRHSFHRVLMRSAAKLAYPQAQKAIDGKPDEVTDTLVEPVLRPLWAAYHALAHARDAREPLALDLPERKLILKEDGTVDHVLIPERLDAHRLIEEFMILANVCAAETLEKSDLAFTYRVHDEPSLEKMRVLGEVLASIGLKLPKGGVLHPSLFNRILASVDKTPHRAFINEIVLRSQAQAEYSTDNYGHFGLALRRYAHFTSPIRRYADLIVHRSLIRHLKLGDGGLPASTTREEMAEVAARISAAERRAMAAERETIDRLIAHYMADHVGATFEGQIAGVTGSGLFVKLDHTGADGFIPAATLGADYFRFDERQHALVGSRSGEVFRLGDRVTVRLVEAAPVAGALRFEMLSDGKAGARQSAQLRARSRNAKSFRPGKSAKAAERAAARKAARQKGARDNRAKQDTTWPRRDD